ncbi:hypothetical protein BUALT_Bualt12G0108400 [Buddleja alternifolia]|uniref:Uncharacterized protein n=1 Tax=Buddleja alternifolia TaxID=168488 RepID=A0AAV6WP79_9LAMI|nr:hypothetical protein BUALT_Bualt12G0108400 [Buddleja alternifolia]
MEEQLAAKVYASNHGDKKSKENWEELQIEMAQLFTPRRPAWSKIAQHLPGRTDNEIKNYWRTRVQKHAKQLKCDVNSKQFKDTMRYLWMPRLVERIQAAATATATTAAATATAAAAATSYQLNTNNLDMGSVQILPPPPDIGGGVHTYSPPENSSAAASSDSFGTQGSDVAECYNNYPVNQGNNQDYYPANQLPYGDQSLTSPTAYLNHGLDFIGHGSQWMDGGDVSDSLWNVDDVWFLQNQFNGNV